MIVGSLVLILVAIALLVLGLASGSSGLLISSIGASLLAAVALVVGARQAAALRIEVDPAGDRMGFSPTASGRGRPRSPTAGAFTGPGETMPAEPDPDHDLYRGPIPRTEPDSYRGAGRYSGPTGTRRPDPFDGPEPATVDPDSPVDPDPLAGSDPFADPDPSGDSDPFAGPDPFPGVDPARGPEPRDDGNPLRRPDPFADGGSPRSPETPRRSVPFLDEMDQPAQPDADPFTRPDPFADPEPSFRAGVPSQGGQPADETDEMDGPRWRHPAGPYRRSARAGEYTGEDGDAFAVVDIPPDEPDAQQVPAATAARIAGLGTEVMVIDGRPRYHLASCPHLVGRESEPLPVSEAVELGFTPCGRCEPDDHLLADSGRV